MLNVKDIPKYTAEIRAAIDEAIASYGTPNSPAVDELVAKYTGPATGLWWDAGKKSLFIAKGWCEDEDGNIVDPVECTGPATGLEYRDGKVRRVK